MINKVGRKQLDAVVELSCGEGCSGPVDRMQSKRNLAKNVRHAKIYDAKLRKCFRVADKPPASNHFGASGDVSARGQGHRFI